MIELGRYLVGECGVYVTRVVDRKVSRGETYLVVDGGMHHQLADKLLLPDVQVDDLIATFQTGA